MSVRVSLDRSGVSPRVCPVLLPHPNLRSELRGSPLEEFCTLQATMSRSSSSSHVARAFRRDQLVVKPSDLESPSVVGLETLGNMCPIKMKSHLKRSSVFIGAVKHQISLIRYK